MDQTKRPTGKTKLTALTVPCNGTSLTMFVNGQVFINAANAPPATNRPCGSRHARTACARSGRSWTTCPDSAGVCT